MADTTNFVAAEDRTNMVSLLDIGLLNGGAASDIQEMGNGYEELTEDWGPKVDTKQYVNMSSESSTVSGYSFSMSPERDYISDTLQEAIDTLSKEFPTGTKCATYYYRFYKTDMKAGTDSTTMSGDCIRVPVVVTISSVGGSGGESLKSTIQINGNGSVGKGTVTLSGGKYTWASA